MKRINVVASLAMPAGVLPGLGSYSFGGGAGFEGNLRYMVIYGNKTIDKIGEFQPEFVGKMQFYLTALDRQVREEGENPAIGIILCKEKNRTVVEYALYDAKKPIGVATYRMVKRLPRELKGQLPSPDEIAKLLGGVE